jgi:glycosyltransferase involved in cell wall biosynthesis
VSGAPRIGVVFTGDPSRAATWSGTPAGIVGGLREAGMEVVGLSVALPRHVERAVTTALAVRYRRGAAGSEGRSAWRVARHAAGLGPHLARLRTAKAARVLGRAAIDAVVQIGTGYLLPPAVPAVTLEDMTIAQLRHYPYAEWEAMGRRDHERRSRLQRRAYAAAVACCATSTWAARSIADDYGVAPERTHAVGVGTAFPRDRAARDWSRPRFLFVGREWERKNGPRVIRAFARLRADHPDAELHVVGGHPPVDQPGVTGHGVLALGDPSARARLRELLRASTCFVMPSLFEPSAIAYVEAATAGLPSIGTRNGGSADLIGTGGVVVDPMSEDAILAALRLLAEPGRAEALGELAWERSALFTWEAVAQRLLRPLGHATRVVADVEPTATPEVTAGALGGQSALR